MLPRRNVLIFHLGALGDFILTWPLALALSRLHPQSRIRYVTHAQKGKLAERLLGVESIDIEGGWHALHGDPDRLPEPARRTLESAHSVYSFVTGAGDAWSSNVATVSGGAPVLCIAPKPPADYAGHVTEHQRTQLAAAPAVAEAVRQMLVMLERGPVKTPAPAGNSVVIHPGSGGRGKCWALGRFVELGHRLVERGRSVRFVIGEAEVERWPDTELSLLRDVAPVRQPATLLDLHAELAQAGTYIGNDSGPTHLAGVMGLRTLAIFGPTSARVWRPLGPQVRTIEAPVLEQLSVDEVESQVFA